MGEEKIIYILLDYAGRFYSTWEEKEKGFNLNKFVDYLGQKGYKISCIKFCDIDFDSMQFKDSIVLYSSSEVGYYKEYIEDILLGIYYQGGRLIPNYYLFRAHHNKSFQEVYRKLLFFGNLNGKSFGTLNEFIERIQDIKFPIVLKTSGQSGSLGVFLAKNYKDAIKKAKKISDIFDCATKRWYFRTKDMMAVKLKKRAKTRIYKNNSKKFVIQEYIPNLNDDWKVLIFGKKYYILNRKVRKGDFRASGSGNFSYIDPPEGLLDFSETIFEKLNSPYASLDILFDGNNYYLAEFQALYFGLYTILHADFYYEKSNGIWRKRNKTLSVEEEMADCITTFINGK